MTSATTKRPTNPEDKAVAQTNGKPPYPFRTAVALILLAGNFLVAAFYFGILK